MDVLHKAGKCGGRSDKNPWNGTYGGADRACYYALQANVCDLSKMQLPQNVRLQCSQPVLRATISGWQTVTGELRSSDPVLQLSLSVRRFACCAPMSWLQKAPIHSQHMDAVHAGHLERPDLTITRRKKRHSQGTNGHASCKCRTHDVRT
jgi:hypothetical protein